MTKVVTILSGGMDSATLAYWLKLRHDREQLFLTFDYGQRHRVEIGAAANIAKALACEHRVIDVTGVGKHLKGSALTDAIDVPHGHYAEESMRKTVVPNRNAIMLSVAWGVMVAEEADGVATGVHAGDHYIYPDCRPPFIDALGVAFAYATEGHSKPGAELLAPFINMTKREIGALGKEMEVPFNLTWSCYEGGDVHCGQCGACNERKEALAPNDTTVYLA